MSDNKVDLSTVNKTKRPTVLQKIRTIFTNSQGGPLRDSEGKFASTTGSGGLSRTAKLESKRVVPVIMVIAVVGGFFVYSSFASGSQAQVTSWYRTCSNREPDSGGLAYWSGRLDKGEHVWAVADAFMKESGVSSCNYPDEPKTPKKAVTSTQPATPATQQQPAATGGTASSGDSRVAAYYRACGYSSIPQSGTNHDYWKGRLDAEKEADVWAAFKASSEKNGRTCPASSPLASSTSGKATTTQGSSGIPQYNASLTDFMDTRAFVWFAYRQICYAGTGTGVSWWVTEIDAGRWTRENFWKHLAAQPCAQSTAQKRADQDKNLTEDGKKMKEIDAQLNAKYWEVFLAAWEEKGYGDWDGKTRTGWGWLEDSDPEKARIACEEMVWNYKNGIPVGLSDTCFKLVTGIGKNITSQDVMYGDYFGDPVPIEVAISRIDAIKQGQDQAISCQSAKAQLLPACGAGAIYAPVEGVEKELERRKEAEEEALKQKDRPNTPSTSSEPRTPSAQQPSNRVENPALTPEQKTPSSSPKNNVVDVTPTPAVGNSSSMQQSDYEEEDIYGGDVPYSDQIEQLLSIENSVKASVVYPYCDGFDDIELSAEDECVEYAETALALISDPNITIDGVFDEETQDLLVDFQDSRNVVSSERGKLGKSTYELLNKALEPRISESPYSPPTGTLVNNR